MPTVADRDASNADSGDRVMVAAKCLVRSALLDLSQQAASRPDTTNPIVLLLVVVVVVGSSTRGVTGILLAGGREVWRTIPGITLILSLFISDRTGLLVDRRLGFNGRKSTVGDVTGWNSGSGAHAGYESKEVKQTTGKKTTKSQKEMVEH